MSVSLYALLFTAALGIGFWLFERSSQDKRLARSTYLIGIWSGLAGARIWYAAQYGSLSLWGGLSMWGFLMGAALGSGLYLRLRLRSWSLGGFPDAAAPVIALGAAIHRLGCYSAGCCFGKVSNLPWAVQYGPGFPAYQKHLLAGLIPAGAPWSLSIHPTQLYLSAGLFMALGGVLWIKRGFSDRLLPYELLLGLAVYGSALRFAIEYLRDDSGGVRFGPLSFAQATTALVGLAAFGLLAARRLQNRR